MESDVKFDAKFDEECRRYGYDGMEDFEKTVVHDLCEHKEMFFVFSKSVQWLIASLKNYYGIEVYLTTSNPVSGGIYRIIIKNNEKFIDDYKLDNYFN